MMLDTKPPFGNRRPDRDQPRPDSPRETQSPFAPGRRRPRLLLVEDEDAFSELLQAYLENEGFTVHGVKDGRAGAAWLGEHSADLIITDLCMPNTDGMEFLMELRKGRSKIPIIVMSGGVRGEMAGMLRAATLLGARRTLAKPFPLQQLATAVREALPANR